MSDSKTALTKTETGLQVPKTFDKQQEFFTQLIKGSVGGVKTVGDAMLVYQKAKELGIGWGNALPHMHIVDGKPGVDIHILKAILSKPGSGVQWEHTEDNVPVYQYLGEDQAVYQQFELPPNHIVVTSLSKEVEAGKFRVAILPTNVEPDPKKPPIFKKLPVDYRSTYIFTRKKRDIDGAWITVTAKGSFSWREAINAGLVKDSPKAAWNAYRNLMINTRAFTFGAREIADDLLMGNYETTELLDFSGVNYDITTSGGEVGNVTILDKDGKKVSPDNKKE